MSAMRTSEEKTGLWLKVISAVMTVVLIVVLVLSIMNMGRDSRKDGLRQLETSVRRSVTACYATEGVYPPNLDYLKEHYGLQVDEDRFIVHYSIFAENMMPDITVLERVQ